MAVGEGSPPRGAPPGAKGGWRGGCREGGQGVVRRLQGAWVKSARGERSAAVPQLRRRDARRVQGGCEAGAKKQHGRCRE